MRGTLRDSLAFGIVHCPLNFDSSATIREMILHSIIQPTRHDGIQRNAKGSSVDAIQNPAVRNNGNSFAGIVAAFDCIQTIQYCVHGSPTKIRKAFALAVPVSEPCMQITPFQTLKHKREFFLKLTVRSALHQAVVTSSKTFVQDYLTSQLFGQRSRSRYAARKIATENLPDVRFRKHFYQFFRLMQTVGMQRDIELTLYPFLLVVIRFAVGNKYESLEHDLLHHARLAAIPASLRQETNQRRRQLRLYRVFPPVPLPALSIPGQLLPLR